MEVHCMMSLQILLKRLTNVQLYRLMGPRRKLTQAISELKEHEKQEENASKRTAGSDDGQLIRKTSRPQLKKQSSTDVTEAYRQVCHYYVGHGTHLQQTQ